jgi:hypothetical protein
MATWDRSNNVWKEREKLPGTNRYKYTGGKGCPVGRMYFVHPSQEERYYLRLLLTNVPGATSYEDLRTTDLGTPQQVLHETFKAACLARGLLQDDSEWDKCMDEARVFASGRQLRAVFATLLTYCEVAQPKELWEKYYKVDMTEDLLHNARAVNPARALDEDIVHRAFREIRAYLSQRGWLLSEFPNHPLPPPPAQGEGNVLVDEERHLYDRGEQAQQRQQAEAAFNPEQRAIYDAVVAAISATKHHMALVELARDDFKAARDNTGEQSVATAAASCALQGAIANATAVQNLFFADGVGGAGCWQDFFCTMACYLMYVRMGGLLLQWLLLA